MFKILRTIFQPKGLFTNYPQVARANRGNNECSEQFYTAQTMNKNNSKLIVCFISIGSMFVVALVVVSTGNL